MLVVEGSTGGRFWWTWYGDVVMERFHLEVIECLFGRTDLLSDTKRSYFGRTVACKNDTFHSPTAFLVLGVTLSTKYFGFASQEVQSNIVVRLICGPRFIQCPKCSWKMTEAVSNSSWMEVSQDSRDSRHNNPIAPLGLHSLVFQEKRQSHVVSGHFLKILKKSFHNILKEITGNLDTSNPESERSYQDWDKRF